MLEGRLLEPGGRRGSGIYYTTSQWKAENKMYEINTDLTLDVVMEIIYNGNVLNTLTQANWWVCSFTPDEQFTDLNALEVNIEAAFTNPALYPYFYDTRWPRRNENTIEAKALSLGPRNSNSFVINY